MTGLLAVAESSSGKTALAHPVFGPTNVVDTDDGFELWCKARDISGWDALDSDAEMARFRSAVAPLYARHLTNGYCVATWDVRLAEAIMDACPFEVHVCAFAYRSTTDLLAAKADQAKDRPARFSSEDRFVSDHRAFLASVVDHAWDIVWIPEGRHLGDVL